MQSISNFLEFCTLFPGTWSLRHPKVNFHSFWHMNRQTMWGISENILSCFLLMEWCSCTLHLLLTQYVPSPFHQNAFWSSMSVLPCPKPTHLSYFREGNQYHGLSDERFRFRLRLFSDCLPGNFRCILRRLYEWEHARITLAINFTYCSRFGAIGPI